MRSISKIKGGLVSEEELSDLKVLIKRRFGPVRIVVMVMNIGLTCISFIALLVISLMILESHFDFNARDVIYLTICCVGMTYVLLHSLRSIKRLRDLKLVLNKIMDAETPEDLEGTIVEKFLEENS